MGVHSSGSNSRHLVPTVPVSTKSGGMAWISGLSAVLASFLVAGVLASCGGSADVVPSDPGDAQPVGEPTAEAPGTVQETATPDPPAGEAPLDPAATSPKPADDPPGTGPADVIDPGEAAKPVEAESATPVVIDHVAPSGLAVGASASFSSSTPGHDDCDLELQYQSPGGGSFSEKMASQGESHTLSVALIDTHAPELRYTIRATRCGQAVWPATGEPFVLAVTPAPVAEVAPPPEPTQNVEIKYSAGEFATLGDDYRFMCRTPGFSDCSMTLSWRTAAGSWNRVQMSASGESHSYSIMPTSEMQPHIQYYFEVAACGQGRHPTSGNLTLPVY